MANYSIELTDSALEKFLSQTDVIINKEPISKDKENALEFLKRLYDLRHNIKRKDKEERDTIKELFIGLYYSYCDKFQFDKLLENIDKIDFSKVNKCNRSQKLISLLKNVDDPESNILNEFLCIPYNYESSQDEFIKEIIKKLKGKGLIKILEEYHELLKIYCKNEEAKEYFTLLLKKGSNALVEALQFASTISLWIKVYEAESKDDKYSSENGYDLYKNDSIKHIIDKAFKKIKNKIDELESYRKEQEIKQDTSKQVKKTIEAVLNRYEEEGIYTLKDQEWKELSEQYSSGTTLLLKSILLHNKERDLRMCNRLHDNDRLTSLKQIFKESCFSFDTITSYQAENLIEKKSLDEIKEILDLFTSTNEYSTSFPIYDILLLSSKDIIIKINQLLKDRKISIGFIENNPEIFIDNIPEELQNLTSIKDAKHTLLMNNVSLLDGNSINTYNLSNSSFSSILLMDNQTVQERLELINSYKLQYKDAKDFSIFLNPELIKKVDSFIELGFAEFIKNRPNYITESIDTSIKRLRICRDRGMAFNKYEEIDKVIRSTQFSIDGNLISDDELDNFIPDATKIEVNLDAFAQIMNSKIRKIEDKEIPELEQYKKNPLVYKINGVTISRQKVLRNLSILENSDKCKNLPRNILLFNALVCGSIFDYYQLAILNNSLNQDIEKLEK